MAKYFNRGVFLGTVTKYLPPRAPDQFPLWQIVYDDDDKEQWDESDLKEGVSLFHSKPSLGFHAAANMKSGGPDKKIKRFKACGKDLYDFSWVSASSLSEQELEEYKLHLFTHNLTHTVEDAVDDPEVNHEVDGPLGSLIREREEKKRLWENNNCRVRPFRPFSTGIGKRRSLSGKWI